MAILELKEVCYSYRKKKERKKILEDVSASFEQGKVYAVIGRSGSGKTTMLSLLAGLDIPDEGQVVFEGKPTSEMNLDEYRKTCTAVIYQNFCLFPLLTVLENIMYPMELCHVKEETALAQAKKLAEKVSLPENLFDSYPGKISGGEQQRVAIARALAMGRRVILADEPTGNLDGENADIIIELLKVLAHEENRCIVVVTHDMDVVNQADVVLRLIHSRLELM